MNSVNADDVETLVGMDAETQARSHLSKLDDSTHGDLCFTEANIRAGFDAESERWDVMFDAVLHRLTKSVSASSVLSPNDCDLVGVTVSECVEALHQLQATREQERDTHRSTERRALMAAMALATAQEKLHDTELDARRARHVALHDGLTALPNRSLFRWQLERALEQAIKGREALAVIYLDLDGFKPINDEHGHHTGDALLKIVAARMRLSLRADDIVGRIGGDEFACVLANVQSRGRLNHIARKLFDTVAAPLMIGNLGVTVIPSFGIARFPVDGATADELLEKADAAMFDAKRRKSGFAFFLKHRDAVSRVASRPLHPLRANAAIQARTWQQVPQTYA